MEYEEIILKIMSKVLLVNANTNHTVFIRFSGHVDLLEMDIHINGWEEQEINTKFNFQIYLKEDSKRVMLNLNTMLQKLIELENN